MGRRGPKPTPVSVKVAKGNPGRRPLGENPDIIGAEQEVEQVVVAVITAPSWLQDEGLKVWERLAGRLAGQKLLFQLDAESFARYCKNFASWLKMQEALDAEGFTYESESPHGTYKRSNPAYMIADRLEKQLSAAEANFGLNPAERQRLFAARAAGSFNDLFNNNPASPDLNNNNKNLPAEPNGVVGFLN